jgi:hypothetical protein
MRNPILLFAFLLVACGQHADFETDVLVVGGGASGTTAGIQAARMGAGTLLTEESDWLGGMLTAAGVSAVDGNHKLPGGLWGEFRRHLRDYYGGPEALHTGWVSAVLFEPSVGNRIFHDMTAREPNLTVWKESTVEKITRRRDAWFVVVKKGGATMTVRARVMIDATELGDVAAACGVKYDTGMESRLVTGESIAPEHANDIIQDLTYVMILKDYGRDVSIPRPEGYDPAEFACCSENPHCVAPKEPDRHVWPPRMMLDYGKLPNGKYMINWPIEGNDYYVDIIEMTPAERVEALEPAKARSMRFLYFMQHELGFKTLGLADDEYDTPDRLPLIPYHRESRRIDGLVRFTINHIDKPFDAPQKLYRTNIAVGDYPVDHHHMRYEGFDSLPNLYFHPIPAFGLPLGTLIPREVEGLIVAEKSISVSNIVNGCTRLQPVVLQIGQAAGALAALAVHGDKRVADVAVRDVQNALLEAGGYLLPYLDVPVGHPAFKSYQRIGSTGIMRGEGRSVNWSNEMWFRADSVLMPGELAGLAEVYPELAPAGFEGEMTQLRAVELVDTIARLGGGESAGGPEEVWQKAGLENFDPGRPVLRGEMAILIDRVLDPFNGKPVDIEGAYVK